MRDLKKLCALGLLLLAVAALAQAADAPAELFSYRRVMLAADQVAAQEERVRLGELVQLPRDQFEELVRQANAAANPPRLVETRYRGQLVDTALEGSAEWKIANPGPGGVVLPVQPLGIALRQARWRGGAAAILGNFQGGQGLWVEAPGESLLELGWSARSNPVTGGLRFTLDVPACAIGFLELELPSDRAISVSRDAFHLNGPLPTATPNHQLWRLGFSGRSQLSFVVRKVAGPGLPAPLVLVRQQTRQVLTPGELQADFDFELEVLHFGVTKLTCECDPGLRPYQVSIRNLESWILKAGKTPTAPSQLQVRLREPFQGGLLQVKCLASVSPGTTWTAPAIRLSGAVVREETLALHVDPEVQLEDWQSGSFRLLRSSMESDGQQQLSLSAGLESGAGQVRPKAKLVTPGPEFNVRQLTWWELTAERQRLISRLNLEVSRGRVFRLPLQVPPGWEVEQVEMEPADRLGHWSDKAKPLLMVDLQRSLDPSTPAKLTVRLRREPAAGALPFPDLVPLGARQRDGALGISVSSSYLTHATASVPAVVAGVADKEVRPWGKQALDYYYPYQGRPVEGTLTLRTRANQVRAACSHDLVVAASRALLVTRLELYPEAGSPREVDLFIAGPDLGPWDWRPLRGGNQVERQDRLDGMGVAAALAPLAARHSLQAASLIGLPRPRGGWWRLTLARPLTEPLTLEARHELTGRTAPAALAAQLAPLASRQAFDAIARAPALLTGGKLDRPVWDVPLVCVPSAERLEGTVTLHLAGTNLAQVEALGLREVASGPTPRGKSTAPWRTYRYSQPPVSLTLRGGAPADRSRLAVIDAAALTSYLEPSGRLVHHFRFRIRDWRVRTIPVRLPATAQLLAARGDGQWLVRLPPAKAAGQEVEYELPVAGGAGTHQFEVLYAAPPAPFALWQRLQAPAPALPVEPLTLERAWCLPPGVAPLAESGLQRLPGDVGRRPWLPSFPAETGDWQARQSELLKKAILALRKEHQPAESWSLGEVLERVAIDHLKDRVTLVIDTDALADLNLQATTPLPAAAWDQQGQPWSPADFPLPVPWESVGVVYVPTPAGALLTTRPWQLAWQEDPETLTADGSIAQAIAEAARHGQDSSGRFRRVLEWLDHPLTDRFEQAEQVPLTGEGLEEGWTAWEPLPGSSRPDTLLVLRPGPVPLTGILLGVALAFAAIRVGPQPGRRRFRLFLIWLAIGGLGLIWLPPVLRPLAWGPALVGMVVGLIWCGRLALGLRRATAAVATAALFGLMLYPHSWAAPLDPVVYFLPEPASGPAQVLAPPDLLAQLRKQADPPPQGVRLLTAEYRGKVEGHQATFEARYRLHAFDPQPATLLLPLTGVQLVDAELDDKPAQPIAQDTGYSIRVPGGGEHQLVVRFAVALPQGEERDLRFGIPELAQSRFVLEAPASTSFPHVVEARGGQRLVTEGQRVRLEADLGQVASVRARWRQEDAQSKPGAISVREGYCWELKPTSARLLAVLHYTVQQGWINRVGIELPGDLEVVSVDAGPPPGSSSAPRLKDWSLRGDGNKRRLEVEFQGPVTASVLVTLELVPRQPLGRAANLPFPTPLEGQPGRGFLAYRLEDLEAPAGQEKALAITGMRKEEQESAFNEWLAVPWALARQEKLLPPSRYFWRMRGGVLQLALQPPAVPVAATQDLSWRIDPRQATLRATATVTSPEPRLTLVQWEVPANLQVADVSGALLAHWTRSGNRIQAWLRKPADKVNLQLTGWLPRPPKAPPRFDLPLVRVLDVTESKTTLRVVAAESLALQPAKLINLTPRSALDIASKELHFSADQDAYGGSFTLMPATASAYFHLLTFAEIRDRQLAFDGSVECTIHPGGLRQMTLSLRNWEGGDVQVTASGGKVEERKAASGRLWVVDLPPSATRQFSVKLHGQASVERMTDTRMPDLRVESADDGPAPQERWLAVAGSDLEAVGASGLEPQVDASGAVRSWPREADRLRRSGGAAWKARDDDWRLRLAPRGPAVSPVQLLLAEHVVAAGDQPGWLHRATYWLAHEGGADLALTLRDGARILGVQVNGVPAPPLLQGSGQRLWLPLTGGAGVQTVEVLWTSGPGQETIEQPILDPPSLEGVAPGPQVWTIHVPAGYQLHTDHQTSAVQSSSVACLDLSRAAATLRQIAWLAERGSASHEASLNAALAAANRALEHHLRFAEHRLALAENADDRQALTDWLQGLRQQRAELGQQPALRPLGVKEPPVPVAWDHELSPFEEGRPAYWYGPAGAGVPSFRLVSQESTRLRYTATLSVLVFALLFASWILASLFGATAWPEQMALLGTLGWLVFGGVGLIFLLLPAGWLLIRLYHLGRLSWSLLPRRAAVEPPVAA